MKILFDQGTPVPLRRHLIAAVRKGVKALLANSVALGHSEDVSLLGLLPYKQASFLPFTPPDEAS